MDHPPDHPLILVVDDNAWNLQLVAEVLEGGGMNVALAGLPRAALDFLATESCDLILLDMLMPGMNGIELCQKIKEDPRHREVPVVFLTGMAETYDIVLGFEAGAVDYVTKPFRGPELLARVRTHVELFWARREIRDLRGILPVCAYCRKVRDAGGDWRTFEEYLADHSAVQASHGVCPECRKAVVAEMREASGRP